MGEISPNLVALEIAAKEHILPTRPRAATARVKLAGHRVEECSRPSRTFCLVNKNNKKTVYLKVSNNNKDYFLFVGMPYNWSFYHPDPIEGEEGGILLFCYSIIYVYGLTLYILMVNCEDRSPSLLLPPSGIMPIEYPSVSKSYAINRK